MTSLKQQLIFPLESTTLEFESNISFFCETKNLVLELLSTPPDPRVFTVGAWAVPRSPSPKSGLFLVPAVMSVNHLRLEQRSGRHSGFGMALSGDTNKAYLITASFVVSLPAVITWNQCRGSRAGITHTDYCCSNNSGVSCFVIDLLVLLQIT